MPLLLGAAQRIETAYYIGTIVDSMTWRQAKYPAPDRPFGRPGGHAGMGPGGDCSSCYGAGSKNRQSESWFSRL